MDNTEMDEIYKALERINKCLDERFEENAKFYIAPEQVEKLKKLIYLGNYPQLTKHCFVLKTFSPEVMANVLIKNAWLMKKNPRYFLLKQIFETCDNRYLQSVMREGGVFENKLDMPSVFRLMLIEIFLNRADPLMCRQILSQNVRFLNRPRLCAACIVRAIKDESPVFRYALFKKYVKEKPGLLTEENILKTLFPPNDITDPLKEEFFKDLGADFKFSKFLINRLSKDDAEYIFNAFYKFCRSNPTSTDKAREILPHLFSLAHKDSEKNIRVLATYLAKSFSALDGRGKNLLAENALTKIKSEEASFFIQEFAKYGINVQKRELADLEGIIEALNEDRITQGKYKFLAKSFKDQYSDDYLNRLEELRQQVYVADVFKEFCCYLVELTYFNHRINMRYLTYLIENLIETTDDKSNYMVKRILKYIENNNIFNTCGNINGIDKVRAFVKEKDFELFSRLTQF